MSLQAADRRSPLLLTGFGISVLIAIAVVLRRLYAFANPNPAGPPQLVALDQVFEQHRGLTLAHILPALLFVMLASFALLRGSSTVVMRMLLFVGTVVGVTAYGMSSYAVGGRLEQAAVLVFNSLFLYWLWRGYLRGRVGETEEARRCYIRAVAILLGIATTRPVMGFFFATSRLTGLQPNQFFGIAFWIGFAMNTLGVEWWIRAQRRNAQQWEQL